MARAVRRAQLIQERELAAARRRRRGIGVRAPSSMPLARLFEEGGADAERRPA